MGPLQRKFWVWAVSVLVLAAVVWSLPPTRVGYHKSKLQGAKAKKAQLMTTGLSRTDKFWLQVLGQPLSVAELNRKIQKHEEALVQLGFLRREMFEAQTESNEAPATEALATLRSECPWYHAQAISGTNFVVIACPKMMDGWRKRAQDLGWKSRGKC